MSIQTIHSEGINVSLPTLESVKLDFLNWRSNPYRSAHIPESLWESVILLLSQHSKSKVLTTLGISNAQLTKKLKSREQTSVAVSPPLTSPKPITIDNKFVKAIAAPEFITTYCDITLTKPNGATLQIQKLPHHEVLKLAELFVG